MRNVTDVDDDILRKAREVGVYYLDLAAEEMAKFDAAMDALDLLPCFSEPRATSAIPDILGFIGMVLEAGPRLSGRGSGVLLGGELRRSSARSVTTRASRCSTTRASAAATSTIRTRRTRSTSCCGSRRPKTSRGGNRCGAAAGPGWHIECSALAMRELGETIDLHGGGGDLIFPHHECEAAQSEAATGAPFVRHWMHGGMVRLDGEKMSKSLGNLVFAEHLLKEWEPAAVRLACVAHHYRPGWDWTDELMPDGGHAGSNGGAAPAPATPRSTTCATVSTTTSTRPARSPRSTPPSRAGHGASNAAALLGVTL